MRSFLWVVLILDQLFLLLVGAVRLEQYELSEFVLREQFGGRSDVYSKLRRSLNKRLPKVRRLQQIELVVAFALGMVLWTHLNSPAPGFLYAFISLFIITLLQRGKFTQRLGSKLFERSLDLVIKVVDLLNPIWWLLGTAPHPGGITPSSPAELHDYLRKLPESVASATEKKRLEGALAVSAKTVKDIMTPKKKVVTISPHTTLGPVVLSDLEKSGHGYFPVVTSKDEVEGVLELHDVANLQSAKQHSSVRELMSMQLAWVNIESSLLELLQVFIREKQYLVLVRNLENEFSGVVTVADVFQQVLAVTTENQ